MSSSTTDTSTTPATTSKWNGSISQEELMIKDTVIVVNDDDHVIGSCSKQDSHVFSPKQPHGVLHRAFSVFLFDTTTNQLLLQQRAISKITFSAVWTNTCCSHPLHGMDPQEVDEVDEVQRGYALGVKHAALRKLEQELGIPLGQVKVEDLKFITRLHYWAADTKTHGSSAPWGEHEIDYVLLCRLPKEQLTILPNLAEIENIRWVSPEDLQNMLRDDNLLFSPWFRIICARWLMPTEADGGDSGGWWKNLERCLTTDDFCDYTTVHTFDPPPEHLGGGGQAGLLFSKQTALSNSINSSNHDESKKQGAYGKISIHKEPMWLQLLHVDEVMSAIRLLYIHPLRSNLHSNYIKSKYKGLEKDLAFCDDILEKVSRSFAAVIRQLPPALLVDVMIFYLVLRALDTVEDDTAAFESMDIKVQHLRQFHQKALVDPTWSMDGVGQADERRLLQEFPKAHRVFAALPESSRQIISDITERMANGMAEFVSKDMGQGTVDVPQYNRYCHFVAGLVGEGLSRLFAASGLEDATLAEELHLSDQMGLFLQKTNIIRDYLEDYVDQRAFWPQSVWKKYSKTGELGYFTLQNSSEVRHLSLQCLNELVTDALELAPDCLAYMKRLTCVEVFRFCAIPQVMAIATLDKVYNNPNVFTGVVKIRKGLSCQLILRTNNLAELQETFFDFATTIRREAQAISAAPIPPNCTVVDPLLLNRTIQACDTILGLTADAAMRRDQSRLMAVLFYMGLTGLATWLGWYLVDRTSSGQLRLGWHVALRAVWILPLIVYFSTSGVLSPKKFLARNSKKEKKN